MRSLLFRAVTLLGAAFGPEGQVVDLLLRDGLVAGLGDRLSPPPDAVVAEREGLVVAPAFLDLHCHLREPGQPWKEKIATASAAAAAGGFGAVCAMANLVPPVDRPDRLRNCLAKNRAWGRIPVLQFAAASEEMRGAALAPLRELAELGAAGFSDDGRNALSAAALGEALERADQVGRLVAIHPEDEAVLAEANPWGGSDPTGWLLRPREAEVSAVETAISALRRSGRGRLHLQHLSTAAAVELVREAKREGLQVTAEVTPHHLTLAGPLLDPEARDRELTCNPPLRGEQDREALWTALLDGTLDAVASDHAPHEIPSDPRQRRPPGFSGVQSVISALLTDSRSEGHLAEVAGALTHGPRRVLGAAGAALPAAEVREGEPAHLTVLDPRGSWTPDTTSWLSLGTNTPYWRTQLKGEVLATFSRGRGVYLNRQLAAGADLD